MFHIVSCIVSYCLIALNNRVIQIMENGRKRLFYKRMELCVNNNYKRSTATCKISKYWNVAVLVKRQIVIN